MTLTRIAGGVGALAVIAGAFGAHWLTTRVSPGLLEAYRAGVQYHLVHSVALLALGLHSQRTGRPVTAVATLMLAGVALFSGSLYAMCFSGIRQFGYLTPIGGLLMIAAWVEIMRTLGRHDPS